MRLSPSHRDRAPGRERWLGLTNTVTAGRPAVTKNHVTDSGARPRSESARSESDVLVTSPGSGRARNRAWVDSELQAWLVAAAAHRDRDCHCRTGGSATQAGSGPASSWPLSKLELPSPADGASLPRSLGACESESLAAALGAAAAAAPLATGKSMPSPSQAASKPD